MASDDCQKRKEKAYRLRTPDLKLPNMIRWAVQPNTVTNSWEIESFFFQTQWPPNFFIPTVWNVRFELKHRKWCIYINIAVTFVRASVKIYSFVDERLTSMVNKTLAILGALRKWHRLVTSSMLALMTIWNVQKCFCSDELFIHKRIVCISTVHLTCMFAFVGRFRSQHTRETKAEAQLFFWCFCLHYFVSKR